MALRRLELSIQQCTNFLWPVLMMKDPKSAIYITHYFTIVTTRGQQCIPCLSISTRRGHYHSAHTTLIYIYICLIVQATKNGAVLEEEEANFGEEPRFKEEFGETGRSLWFLLTDTMWESRVGRKLIYFQLYYFVTGWLYPFSLLKSLWPLHEYWSVWQISHLVVGLAGDPAYLHVILLSQQR